MAAQCIALAGWSTAQLTTNRACKQLLKHDHLKNDARLEARLRWTRNQCASSQAFLLEKLALDGATCWRLFSCAFLRSNTGIIFHAGVAAGGSSHWLHLIVSALAGFLTECLLSLLSSCLQFALQLQCNHGWFCSVSCMLPWTKNLQMKQVCVHSLCKEFCFELPPPPLNATLHATVWQLVVWHLSQTLGETSCFGFIMFSQLNPL